MSINPLSYSKEWTRNTDFPAVVDNETQARQNMQYLFTELKNYLNQQLLPFVSARSDTSVLKPTSEGGFAEVELSTVLTRSDGAVPTGKAIIDALSQLGGGDMLRAAYDPTGVVESFSGGIPDYLADVLLAYEKDITPTAVTLDQTAWVGDTAPYTQTVAVDGVTADNTVIVAFAANIPETSERTACECRVLATSQSDGHLTFTAHRDRPTEAIPIVVIIFQTERGSNE